MITLIGNQLKVAPVVVELPVKTTEVFVQVKTAGVVIKIFGNAPLCVTVIVTKEVQPVIGLVTVKV